VIAIAIGVSIAAVCCILVVLAVCLLVRKKAAKQRMRQGADVVQFAEAVAVGGEVVAGPLAPSYVSVRAGRHRELDVDAALYI